MTIIMSDHKTVNFILRNPHQENYKSSSKLMIFENLVVIFTYQLKPQYFYFERILLGQVMKNIHKQNPNLK